MVFLLEGFVSWESLSYICLRCFSGDTLSFLGDQTSYMSICVGEGQDDSLSLLSAQELRQKVKKNEYNCRL